MCRDVPLFIHEGLLCLKAGAKGLAQRYLTEAVRLFSQLDENGHEENFITVLLQLGRNYVQQQQLDYGKGCYEWALLLSISAGLSERTYNTVGSDAQELLGEQSFLPLIIIQVS